MNSNKKDSFGKKFLAYVKANPIVVMLVIVAIIVGITKDNFFSWKNFGNLMSNTAIRFLIALGVSGCLITKGTDLSAGRQAGLAACLSGILIQRADYASRLTKLPEINMFVVLLIVVAIGACLGLLNGIIITKLKVPPFITTLGTQTIVYGLCLVATDAQPIGGFQKSYIELITGRIGDTNGFHLPYLLFVAALFGAFFWFLYNKMRHGKYMYAIGGNEVAAEVSGVNTTKTLMLIYTTAGIMYATAGWLLAGKTGGASTSMGMGYELEAIAACTIGGVSTTGGIGTVSGVEDRAAVFGRQPVLQLHRAGRRHRRRGRARRAQVPREEVSPCSRKAPPSRGSFCFASFLPGTPLFPAAVVYCFHQEARRRTVMLKDVYLARLERLYGDYLKTVQDLEDSRKLGEGMFGFKGGPADNPCHDRFADELRALLEDFAAQEPDSAQVREVMSWIFDAPKRFPRPRTASWMLLAVHGLTGDLTERLSPEDAKALYDAYTGRYKRWERLPNQIELLKKLKART